MAEQVFIFPGQGAQKVGMGRSLYDNSSAAKRIFEQADDALGRELSKIIFEGPEEVLKDTAVQQPAIVTVSAAALEAFREKLGEDARSPAAAGLSLGEYAALYAAGAFDFQTCIRLVTRRGQLMKEASSRQPCGMTVVLNLNADVIDDVCEHLAAETGRVISPANFNCDGQVVIAGETEALEAAEVLLKEKGARRVLRLPVSGAFHTKLMQPAADGLEEALRAAEIHPAKIPVYSNVDAEPVTEPEKIRENLVNQLTHPVLWMASMKKLVAGGHSTFIEFGPGTTLAGMMKRIERSASVKSIRGYNDVEAFSGE